MPVSGSFSYAATGQPVMQAGSRQWWQELVTVWSAGPLVSVWAQGAGAAGALAGGALAGGALASGSWLRSSPVTRNTSSVSRPLSVWQAATQALQPVQASRSTSKLYCS